jgi:hypothetical protein
MIDHPTGQQMGEVKQSSRQGLQVQRKNKVAAQQLRVPATDLINHWQIQLTQKSLST